MYVLSRKVCGETAVASTVTSYRENGPRSLYAELRTDQRTQISGHERSDFGYDCSPQAEIVVDGISYIGFGEA